MIRLVCINNDGCPTLTMHEVYEVVHEVTFYDTVKGVLVLAQDSRHLHRYYYNRKRFATLDEFRGRKLKKIVGDVKQTGSKAL